jgi:hypothetical protein
LSVLAVIPPGTTPHVGRAAADLAGVSGTRWRRFAHGPRRAVAAAALTATSAVCLAGCGPLPSGAATPSSLSTAGPGAGPTFQLYAPGVPQPTSTPLPNAGYVTAPFPSMTIPTGPGAVVPTSPSQIADPCAARLSEHKLDTVGAVPAPGSVTASWFNDNSGDITSYKIAAVREDLASGAQPAPSWTTLPAAGACASRTYTIGGLVRGARYTVWLDALTTPDSKGNVQERMVGRSISVQIP